MKPKTFTTAALSDDANGICVDQTTGGAADLTLDGALVSGGVATMAEAQIVSIEGTGNNSGITFTITGTNAEGKTIAQAVTGANNGTAVSTFYYKSITQIAASGAVTGNVEIGPLAANGAVTPVHVVNWVQTPFNMAMFVDITGTVTYTVEHTEGDPQSTYTNSYSTDTKWRDTTGLTSLTADNEGNIAFPVRAVRLKLASGTGTTSFTVLQGGQNGDYYRFR